jgi:alpha-galactosidase
VVNAMRTSNDIDRSWDSFAPTARENLNRIWLNGRQWANDPDCILLAGKDLPTNVWQFHATMIHAVGGLSMSGDKAEDLTPVPLAMLKKLMTPSGKGAQFENSRYETGVKEQGKQQYYYLFNWGKEPVDRLVHLKGKSRLTDFWTGQDLGVKDGDYSVKGMAGQSAILIEAELVN